MSEFLFPERGRLFRLSSSPLPPLPKAHLRLTYGASRGSDHADPALCDISFRIAAGQKVLVCGRTGSGKSTLLAALLRLVPAHHHHHQILIDGVDVATVPADAVRLAVVVVPQAPFFLPGSVRLNLTASLPGGDDGDDGGGASSDEALVAALTKVGLWTGLVAERGGLEADMGALALSHGQRQLFSLAAAVVKKKKKTRAGAAAVVVLDEATSGMDDETERQMYQVIEEEFRDCTVIAVAHGLRRAARACDMVIVLAGGRCVEMGHPETLREAKGAFWQMLEA